MNTMIYKKNIYNKMGETIIIILEDDIENLINIVNLAINTFYKENPEIYDKLNYNYVIKRYLLFTSEQKNIETVEEYLNINNISSKFLLINKNKKILKDKIENNLLSSKIILEKNFKNVNIIICVSKKNFLKCKLFSKIIFSNYNIKIISE